MKGNNSDMIKENDVAQDGTKNGTDKTPKKVEERINLKALLLRKRIWSANKYSVLENLDEEVELNEMEGLANREKVDAFINMKKQPTLDESADWNHDDKKVNEHTPVEIKDVYNINNGVWNIMGMSSLTKQDEVINLIAFKNLTICVTLETHLKSSMLDKLKLLKHPLNNLNWSNGNLVEKVKALKEDLKSIQAAIDADPFDKCLRDKGSAILEKYVEAVKDEEKLLFQKCKIKWLSYGDKNNSFFHKMLKGRSQRNRIQVIHDSNGQRYEGDQVAFQFINHFKNFLGINVPVTPITNCEAIFTTKLSNEDASQIIKPITDSEIKKAMFSIGDNKAPGPDGYSAKFFKEAWHIVGTDVCNAVKEFFSSGKLLGELNA
ncbi:hypothetical protein Tco_1470657, partial [Tanacetum coccineum]